MPAIAPVMAGDKPNLLDKLDTKPPVMAPVTGLPPAKQFWIDESKPSIPFGVKASFLKPEEICDAISWGTAS